MLELIFDIVNVVPIDLCLIFKMVIITRLFFEWVFGSHDFPGQSLLLSTTVLNDYLLQYIVLSFKAATYVHTHGYKRQSLQYIVYTECISIKCIYCLHTYLQYVHLLCIGIMTTVVNNNISENSTSLWIIIVSVGVVLLIVIVIITFILFLVLLKKRRLHAKTL